jgi:hypothetical protein
MVSRFFEWLQFFKLTNNGHFIELIDYTEKIQFAANSIVQTSKFAPCTCTWHGVRSGAKHREIWYFILIRESIFHSQLAQGPCISLQVVSRHPGIYNIISNQIKCPGVFRGGMVTPGIDSCIMSKMLQFMNPNCNTPISCRFTQQAPS